MLIGKNHYLVVKLPEKLELGIRFNIDPLTYLL
jgi:hypothetical protein